jgi:BASS family bile acid:Na+ symporter
MKQTVFARLFSKKMLLCMACLVLLTGLISPAYAGEEMYRTFMRISSGQGDTSLFEKLNTRSRELDWNAAKETEFEGTLRLLKVKGVTGDASFIYMVRDLEGRLHILSVPSDESLESARGHYEDLDKLMGNKLVFRVQELEAIVAGETYSFARLLERPSQLAFDRIFKISIVLMLFFVMVGMGLTLTLADFKRVFQKPKGILTGAGLQWLLMPLVAAGLGRLLGFYDTYPFIFVGMVLIAASPGGVTSNLMTYYAKGDLALSVSLTSFSTVLSLVFTPLLLAFYCANVPEVTIPVGMVVQTIIVLVIVPLAVGMTVRARWPKFALKATPFFSVLGIIALLFLIIAGILGNLEVFTDTDRYGFKFYSMVFTLTLLGMVAGAVFPKLFRLSNYQTRAISLETGLRNASLAMALALLIQDYMGDFYGSMFVTSAMFGLLMYIAGFASIWAFNKTLPVIGEPEYEMKCNTKDKAK